MLPSYGDHIFKGLRDSILHLAWHWLKLSKSFEMLGFYSISTRTLPEPLPQHFHEHYLFHQTQEHTTNYCSTFHNVIQDLMDQDIVNLSSPYTTTNPLPTYSTHAVPLLSGLYHYVLNTWGHWCSCDALIL